MKETDGQKEENPEQAIAGMIRQSSEAGQLLSESEILHLVLHHQLLLPPVSDPEKEVGKILHNLVQGDEDLRHLVAPDGSRRYYSANFMTETYAQILLQKQGSRLLLIAEVVRENSKLYPRPVALDMFTHPPFQFTEEEVLNDLERMRREAEYTDVGSVTTSTSRIFLYSTLHLEPGHASMLAEWFDVGQFNNP